MLAREAASAAASPWTATTVCASRSGGLIGAEVGGEVEHRRRARERDEIDLAIEQQPVDVDARVDVEDDLGALRSREIREIVGVFLRMHHEGEAAEQQAADRTSAGDRGS